MDRADAREAVLAIALERLEGVNDDEAWLDQFDSCDWPLLQREWEKLVERITEMGDE